jgi:hypothetical protein
MRIALPDFECHLNVKFIFLHIKLQNDFVISVLLNSTLQMKERVDWTWTGYNNLFNRQSYDILKAFQKFYLADHRLFQPNRMRMAIFKYLHLC